MKLGLGICEPNLSRYVIDVLINSGLGFGPQSDNWLTVAGDDRPKIQGRKMRARISLICLCMATFVFSAHPVEAQTNPQGQQRYTQQQLQELQRRANQAAPAADPAAPTRQRQATPEEMRQMQNAITQQQQQRNNPLASGAAYQPKLPEGFPLPAEETQFVTGFSTIGSKAVPPSNGRLAASHVEVTIRANVTSEILATITCFRIRLP